MNNEINEMNNEVADEVADNVAELTTPVDDEKVEVETPVVASKKSSTKKVAKGTHTVTTGLRDELIPSHVVVKNIFRKKSLTVHHIQRILIELGYTEADIDPDGFYGDGTIEAVKKWQAHTKNEITGIITEPQLRTLIEFDDSTFIK